MPRLTAGTYLRRRREAAELSIDDVAVMIAETAANRPAIAAMLLRIEGDCCQASQIVANQLTGVFAFDPHIYRIIAGGLSPPTLCRVCACSWCDPCDDEFAGPCAWVGGEDLCTHCAAKAAAHLCLTSDALEDERIDHA